ncbi:uncharacterized protein LOC113146996 [Cyclospora cayetanensis]|uniref:Uncharacterized protein LOC113146996 n=1 Tax=Cyclospora cayetanensis TaxID=88456 RepID=A0A6P6RXF7_9EIME|nr:uncharacterized protein LOC113146996 [Cyclospora cayetanensis]
MHVHSDILRGKATVRGDGSWVRVDFPTPMKEALVFLGSLDSISDYSLVPQVGEVDKDGFTVRVTVPSCVVTDLSRTHFSVPYLAWKKTSGSNYIAASITLKMTKGLSGYDTYSRTYHLETSIAKNDDYLTLMQIQNMKAVEDGASEFNTTPYVSVRGFTNPATQSVTYSFSDTVYSVVSSVSIAVFIIGSAGPASLGGAKLQVGWAHSLY